MAFRPTGVFLMKDTMNARERWLAVLQRKKPDRIPLDYWATSEATDKLMKHLGCADLPAMYKRLHIDPLVTVSPQYVGPVIPEHHDVFGCAYESVDYGSGSYRECITHPLAQYETVADIERNYKWPSADWYDYSNIPRQIQDRDQSPVRGGGSEPFLIYKNLRGQEQAMVDLLLYPEVVDYCLDRLFDLAYENTRRIYEAIPGKVMISYVAEDMGGQEALMFSPEQIRRHLIPRMKRVMDLVHSAGAWVFHHNDGAIRSIIPDMIEAGIDALNPIQWRCKGMEREKLKADFGQKLIFHGAMDNQQTLPFGSVQDVVQEVHDNMRILGAGGGYILAPCHNIQAVSPPENIVAMYDTAYALSIV
jgi:uroporphyrinogen decarboxylase